MSTAGRWRELLDRSEWLCAGYPPTLVYVTLPMRTPPRRLGVELGKDVRVTCATLPHLACCGVLRRNVVSDRGQTHSRRARAGADAIRGAGVAVRPYRDVLCRRHRGAAGASHPRDRPAGRVRRHERVDRSDGPGRRRGGLR
ncbi:uncharacterized protein SOCE26_002440 [Sorangium cellulosum]|uniref:Uncharacterized protein n=1 Tax=Sorangium cellulosum TaxID=56 RepID=A0A2L0EHU5_SORCE|nr:uncharacterized protein SOCE26_002440 [Sorangium cellulosum]